MSNVKVPVRALRQRGVEALTLGPSWVKPKVSLPKNSWLEAPCGLKWTHYEHSLHLGAFSYQVSGYCFAARIGRYCSIGENVQIGRQNHAMELISTNPVFYSVKPLFRLGRNFNGAEKFGPGMFDHTTAPTKAKITHIGHDVWIGHGAYICAGVTIGAGAIIGAHSVVTKDVPPFAVVAGNPAQIKRYRMPDAHFKALSRSRWWRYAPWQLTHLDIRDPLAFAAGVTELGEDAIFEPSVFNVADEI